jgi:hypothetical protein
MRGGPRVHVRRGLPLGETWSGPVTGAVTRAFGNDFDVATETVTGAAARPAPRAWSPPATTPRTGC